MILAILIFVTEVITRYWIKQLTRVSVQIHFFSSPAKGHRSFYFFLKNSKTGPESIGFEEWWIFGQVHGQVNHFRTVHTDKKLPVSDYWTRIHMWPNQGFLPRISWSSLTLISESWKTHPKFFSDFCFPVVAQTDFRKTHPLLVSGWVFQKSIWLMTRKG